MKTQVKKKKDRSKKVTFLTINRISDLANPVSRCITWMIVVREQTEFIVSTLPPPPLGEGICERPQRQVTRASFVLDKDREKDKLVKVTLPNQQLSHLHHRQSLK